MGFFSKIINKFTGGNKYERDVKEIMPLVKKTNEIYASLNSLSDDELRGKTQEFRARITEHLKDIDTKIDAKNNEAQTNASLSADDKEEIYKEVDKLKLERDKELEVVLMEILPEAFAVVKDASRRFKENETIRVKATDLDRDLAVDKPHIEIEGDYAIYQNSWEAAGNMIKWDMVHYDVQLIGGIVLHQGKIAEMQTGEGKTLVATLPAYLNGLVGLGVHVVTVNSYLATRDSEWMGGIFNFLGLTIDCIDKYRANSKERKKAYLCDITYGTNNEFGFDYLRDNMTRSPEEMVQQKHHFAMVDEVDSVLVDDARTPLIISGPVPRGDEHEFDMLKPRIEKIVSVQRKLALECLTEAKKLIAKGETDEKTGGLYLLRAHHAFPRYKALIKFLSEPGMKSILQKAENFYMAEQQKNMHIVNNELFFVIDEKQNTVKLTDKGINLITGEGDDPNFFVIPDIGAKVAVLENSDLPKEEIIARKDKILQDFGVKTERIHSVNQLLKAYSLFEKEVDYVVMEGKVKIVDEQTGRIMDGRRYSDGLHQALEAKENVTIEAATQTFATITLQNFFRMYHKLSGMTGTAETEAGEFWEIYKLDCVVIPTNRPIARDDRDDLVYKTNREKYNAVIDEISKLTQAGRPVLVGTTTVEISELLSRLLTRRQIPHNVLNAKQHAREADIVAEAGKSGQVTIATNMAGRGTDIKLSQEVKAAGGLAIIGTERHDSRRVDRQLRGRAGRQGDVGSSQFYVSLEDKLMRLFGSERIAGYMDKLGHKEGEVIQAGMITKSIERAQKKVEENNFGMRKNLLEYDDIMNNQRTQIYKRRRHALFGERLSVDLFNSFYDLVEEIVDTHNLQQNYKGFMEDILRYFAFEPEITKNEFLNTHSQNLTDKIYNQLEIHYNKRMEEMTKMAFPSIQRLYTERGHELEYVPAPFSDGRRIINIPVKLKEAYETEGKSLIKALEKNIALSIIDNSWKEHLREMDNLKTSVQMARHEQKDPLLVYKFEAFELFKSLLGKINRDLTQFLFRAALPMRSDEDMRKAQQEQARKQAEYEAEQRKLQTSGGSEEVSDGGMQEARNQSGANSDSRTIVKPMPVKVGPKIKRNDPCPCGSGKKFKACHGK